MSKSSGVLLPLIFFLVSTSLFSPKLVAFGSPVRGQSLSRPDPLRHFESYNGGYDIRNKHYWTSAAFTGIHGYAIAGVWMLCGLGFGVYMIVKNLSSSSSPVADHPDSYCFIVFLLVLLLTLFALVATGFVLAANQSSLHRLERLKESVLGAGRDARRTISKVTKVMKEMQYFLLPYDPATSFRLNLTTHQLGKESRFIQRFTHKNGQSIDEAIQISYIGHLIVVTINLVLLVAALVLLLLRWQLGIITIIFFFWILTTLCWVLTGIDFFLHNFAEDTCSALEEFELDPQNSSLSSILPCVNSSYSGSLTLEIGSTIHNFISELNSKIATLHSLLEFDEENKYLLGIWEICDPFSGPPNYTYIPNKCPKDAIPISDVPNVLERFTCRNSSRVCKWGGKFLPKGSYDMAWAYSRCIEDMLTIYPDLQSLAQCSFVKNTFSDVVLHQCRPLKALTRSLWSSMLSLSITMVALVLAWVAKMYRDRGIYFRLCSITPDSC